MSQRHLFKVLLAASALAAPGAAYAQCTKDTECKGDRVCERGVCVTPGERSQPQAQPPPPPSQPQYTPPPPPPSVQPARPAPRPRPPPAYEQAWESNPKKNVLSYNVLSTIQGFIVAAGLQAQDPGLGILQVSVSYERALLPNFSILATLTPSFWTDPVGFISYWGITVGGRYYLFGEAPSGFWLGGELGWMPLNIGPGVIGEVGYQWLFDMGLQLGVLGGLVLAPGVNGGIQPGLGLAGTVGWNF